jgi:hypothetical protein
VILGRADHDGELVGLDEMPGDHDAEENSADDRGPQARVVGGDGLRELRLVAGCGVIGEPRRAS